MLDNDRASPWLQDANPQGRHAETPFRRAQTQQVASLRGALLLWARTWARRPPACAYTRSMGVQQERCAWSQRQGHCRGRSKPKRRTAAQLPTAAAGNPSGVTIGATHSRSGSQHEVARGTHRTRRRATHAHTDKHPNASRR